ncbi:MAG: alpha/beta hydrolase [Cyanobacteria bacterium P01_F01_bin.143]
MKHFIITNRLIEITADGQERINEDGKEEATDEIRFAEYDTDTQEYTLFPEPQPRVTLDSVHYKYKLVDGNDQVLLDENDEPVSIDTLHGSVNAFTSLYRSLKQEPEGDVLFFVHGFNTNLNNALDALQTIHERYVENGDNEIKHIVMFTWPAMGSLLEYRDDYRDAELSGFSLARVLLKLETFFQDFLGTMGNEPCNSNLHFMTQSMGAVVLESMLNNLISQNIPLRVLLDKVFLMAADVDWTALEQPNPLYKLVDICETVHIYLHRRDRALNISAATKNPENRLGKYGPKNKNLIPSNISCIDVTGVRSGDFNNHSYFRKSDKQSHCRCLKRSSTNNTSNRRQSS